jgi:hypothetical protein
MPEKTNDELLAEVKRLGNLVSYFEAAEGSAYMAETAERLKAKGEFWEAMQSARARGLSPDTRGFLL